MVGTTTITASDADRPGVATQFARRGVERRIEQRRCDEQRQREIRRDPDVGRERQESESGAGNREQGGIGHAKAFREARQHDGNQQKDENPFEQKHTYLGILCCAGNRHSCKGRESTAINAMSPDGKTFLVTGSTDGVGRQVALELAAKGGTVLVHGRSRERAEQVIGEIRPHGNGNAIFYPTDLSSLQEVRELAETIRRNHDRLDVLINNAGSVPARAVSQRRTSTDGHELRFAVNYLAGFMLTRLLLPLMVASVPARIVNVPSAGQFPSISTMSWLTHGYATDEPTPRASSPRSCSPSTSPASLSTGVTVNCLHPATYMDTTMVRESGVSPISTVKEGGMRSSTLRCRTILRADGALF